MSLDFLLHYGGRRLRQDIEQPPLNSPTRENGDEADSARVNLDFELSPDNWQPRSVASETVDPVAAPQRFIDGCHSGETVAWMRDAENHPIPIRLAEIGGVCMRIDGRALRRECVHVQRIVSLIVDPFPWHEVETFATALMDLGIRLVPAKPPMIDKDKRGLSYDYELMRKQTHAAPQDEMGVLEELALYQDLGPLSLVDGRLGRFHKVDLPVHDVVGVIKRHSECYLHSKGWQVFYSLEPGQRTPAFQLRSKELPVVSWFLKLDGAHGALPNWGIVRVEISCAHFERQRCNFDYLDRISNALLHLRSRQGSYARAPVSMEPIVRAEESLKSLLTSPATLAQRFYHLTGL
jgi:hypothetical protein